MWFVRLLTCSGGFVVLFRCFGGSGGFVLVFLWFRWFLCFLFVFRWFLRFPWFRSGGFVSVFRVLVHAAFPTASARDLQIEHVAKVWKVCDGQVSWVFSSGEGSVWWKKLICKPYMEFWDVWSFSGELTGVFVQRSAWVSPSNLPTFNMYYT